MTVGIFFDGGDLLQLKCIDSKLPPHSRIPVAAGAEEDGRQGPAGGGSAAGE